MENNLIKTKIVATVGPASSDEQILEKLIMSGLNVVRMNFSHGDFDTHQKVFDRVKSLSKKNNKRVALLQDLSGPKIRIGKINGGSALLKEGQKFTLTTEKILGNDKIVYVNYPKICKEIKKGYSVMIFDGKIHLKVLEIKDNKIICKVLVGGKISDNKGVNLPGANLTIKSLTKKDKSDIKFGIKNKVDFIAFSFVRTKKDVLELRNILKKSKSQAMIVSKIETMEAVENIDDILSVSDAVMIARGDLAVEIGAQNVPIVQKNIIKKANKLGKPVITATQMLDSMENSPVPTRAEVSDVANAIFDGTDAIMLSGETASGNYPVESVITMRQIAKATELARQKRQFVDLEKSDDVIDAVTLSVVRVAETVNAKAIIALTESGLTARMISRFHAPYPIFSVSPNDTSCNQLILSYGVFPVNKKLSKNVDEFVSEITDFALSNKIAKKGEKIVLSAGMPFGKVGSTNTLFVLTL